MDGQINGTQTPKRRRRAEAQKKAFEEFDRLQQEELANEDGVKETAGQPEARTYTQEKRSFEESVGSPELNKPTMPRPNYVQKQAWDEENDDDFDDYDEENGGKRRGSGCLIGIIIVLVLAIVVFTLGWFVFPEKKDELLSHVGFAPAATVTPTVAPTAEPTATPTVIPTAEPTATPTATPSPTPTPTPTPSPTPTPTPSPTPTATPSPTPTPTPSPTPTPTPSPTPTPTPSPTPTATPSPTPTPTPSPTPTVVPTPTPTPSPVPFMAQSAEAVEDTAPENVIKSSFILADGVKTDSVVRSEEISMGDPDEYSGQGGVLTFRGGPLRQNAAYGTVEVEQEQLSVIRGVRTTKLDNTYTGFGYGSQPLIVKWYGNIRQIMNIEDASRNTTSMKEVIVPSNDGKIYFYDLDTQAYSRQPIDIGFPITATASVNPYGFPLLYVGQSREQVANYNGVIGLRIYNLINQKLLDFVTSKDDEALGKDCAINSSALIETESDTALYTSENGLLYTVSMNTYFDLDNAEVVVSPEKVAYGYTSNVRNASQGITGSVAAYGDYVYYGDDSGVLQCVDVNTMQPVWVVALGDSIMATPALECDDNGNVSLYVGTTINKTGRSGQVRLMKINALTGETLWECQSEIKGKYASRPAKEGLYAGLMASPLVGDGEINDLVVFNVNRVVQESGDTCAVVYALDKETGEEVWSQPLDVESVSSPIGLYQKDGKSYIVMGDEGGTLRLMDGFSGTTISTLSLGSAIKASPAAYGNQIVVGTTGGMLYFVEVK